jgi:uncharacterized protein (DUF697 family)
MSEPDLNAATAEHPRAVPDAEAVENLILRHAVASAGFGLIPLPLLDLAAITGVNLKMIKDLAEVYGVPFRPELAKSAVSSLLASAGGGALLIGPVASLLKAVPGVGSVVGGLASPGVMGGMTYATGKVFARHFSTGGDLINFDASRFKDMFKRESKAGEAKAAQTTPGAEAAAGA